MTVTRSSAAIRAELTENTKQFNAAREDAIAFERFKAAAGKADALAKNDTKLRAELIEAEAFEDKARKAANYANLRNMTVTAKQNGGPSILAATYIIRFEQNAYSSTYHQNLWGWREVNGFGTLTPEQFGYLVEVAADQIPSGIMALAPGNPVEAFRLYSLGMSRGRLAS
jgi:hypothetical protein